MIKMKTITQGTNDVNIFMNFFSLQIADIPEKIDVIVSEWMVSDQRVFFMFIFCL